MRTENYSFRPRPLPQPFASFPASLQLDSRPPRSQLSIVRVMAAGCTFAQPIRSAGRGESHQMGPPRRPASCEEQEMQPSQGAEHERLQSCQDLHLPQCFPACGNCWLRGTSLPQVQRHPALLGALLHSIGMHPVFKFTFTTAIPAIASGEKKAGNITADRKDAVGNYGLMSSQAFATRNTSP